MSAPINLAHAAAGRHRPQPIRVVSDQLASEVKATSARAALLDAHVATPSSPLADDVSFSFDDAPSFRITDVRKPANNAVVQTPPSTPPNRSPSNSLASKSEPLLSPPASCTFTFDLNQSELLGSGLWSKVYKVVNKPNTTHEIPSSILTPPSTPEKVRSLRPLPQVFAVKSATRPDASDVFEEEASTLLHLQSKSDAAQYIMPFFGFANDRRALVFEAATGGTLESFSTTPSSTAETVSHFPSLATQLVSGLAFLHSSEVIHADIKPANILLDFSPDSPHPIARYCDFSASLLAPPSEAEAETAPTPLSPISPSYTSPPSRSASQRQTAGLGGGTWTYMAPEQLSSNIAQSTPTRSSDVYSLSMTLLVYLLAGQSPYREIEGRNMFLLREAIKMGDAVGFVRRDCGLEERLDEIERCEGGRDMVRFLGLGLKKKREDRVVAGEWKGWVSERGWTA